MSLCRVLCSIYCYAKCDYAECHYAECHYAECHYAECHGPVLISLEQSTIFVEPRREAFYIRFEWVSAPNFIKLDRSITPEEII
jgi:hypothetical protein